MHKKFLIALLSLTLLISFACTKEIQPETNKTVPITSTIQAKPEKKAEILETYYLKFNLNGEEIIINDEYDAYYDPHRIGSGYSGYFITLISGTNEKNETLTLAFPGKTPDTYSSDKNYIDGQTDNAPGIIWNFQGITYQNNYTSKDPLKIKITQYDENGIKGTFEGLLTKVDLSGYVLGDQMTIKNGEFFVPFGNNPLGEKQTIEPEIVK